MTSSSRHPWRFARIGGLDQVLLQTGADLLALRDLDQKLWVALSCPVQGLHLDEKTLALIDADGDGRIRVPEILAAIDWAAARYQDVGHLLSGSDTLELAALDATKADGKVALASARTILANLGKPEAPSLSLAEAADTVKLFAATTLNGDGIIIPESTSDADLQQLIRDMVATLGGVPDRSGKTGVDASQIASFHDSVNAHLAWVARGETAEVHPFGAHTAAAAGAVAAVRAKVDDFFTRVQLADFDPRAASALNRAESEFIALAAKDLSLSTPEIAALPIAAVQPGKTLPLLTGVNPAWAAALATVHATAVTAAHGADKTSLTAAEWSDLVAKLAPFQAWQATVDGAAVKSLGLDRLRAIAARDQRPALAALISADQALAADFNAIHGVEKLIRFQRDFRTLLNNFVNFTDFYSPNSLATFQAGTLYLDSRSTELCIQVAGPNPLAAMSKAYIAYCDCTRHGSAPMKIAACFTQGDSDYLFVGRNGVFYDRKGRDWDAKITVVAENPISIRQAFWLPYKKFVRLIEEQVAKRAAAADADANNKLAAAAEKTAHADKNVKPGEPKKMDIGTVAALGVAVGAIGGALGAVATGLAGLSPLQLPLVPLGLILVISGPSMLIAWLKLRQRTVGPLLEANGWAINGRVKINLPFGTQLTDAAVIPPGASRTLEDPYADKAAARRKRWFWIGIFVIAVAGIRVHNVYFNEGRYFWQPEPPPVAVDAAAEATGATPPAAPAP